MTRDFGGSQSHTATPLAERRIEVIRIASQKLWATVRKQGLQVTKDMCVSEAAMSSNLLLTYGGSTPTQALLGYQPRELYDTEAPGISAVVSALDVQPDAMETALRLRLESKDAILQAVVEDRIARAHNTKVQQHTPAYKAKLKDGRASGLVERTRLQGRSRLARPMRARQALHRWVQMHR